MWVSEFPIKPDQANILVCQATGSKMIAVLCNNLVLYGAHSDRFKNLIRMYAVLKEDLSEMVEVVSDKVLIKKYVCMGYETGEFKFLPAPGR